MTGAALQTVRNYHAACRTCPLGGGPGSGSAPLVVTMIEPELREAFDLAVAGALRPLHVVTPNAVLAAIRNHAVHAVLISPRAVTSIAIPAIARIVAECPGLMPVAVVSERSAASADGLLKLGAHGITKLLDLNDRAGWCRLRCLLSESGGETGFHILEAINRSLPDANARARQFFSILVRSAPRMSAAGTLASTLGVRSSTLVSRFYRARLPSPKQYLSGVRMLYAAAELEVPARSIASVADRLRYSSPQSFGRHVQHALGVTAGELRRRYPFSTILEHYLSRLVSPHRRTFRWFEPMALDCRRGLSETEPREAA